MLKICFFLQDHENDGTSQNHKYIFYLFLTDDEFYTARDRGTERRRSMLTSNLFKIYKNMMDEELQCWKDLQEPMSYFIHLFHHYNKLKQDRKMIEGIKKRFSVLSQL